jgi:iron complex outermembrane receptor protein
MAVRTEPSNHQPGRSGRSGASGRATGILPKRVRYVEAKLEKRMKFKGRDILLATVSLAALTLPGAFAQTAPQVAETPAPAAQTAQATDAIPEVVVLGQGQTRDVQTITSKDILESAPGTSPIKVLSQLPGVNFQAADPFGAYEWATRISIRGFAQNQLGFTLDDIPLGDMSYGNFNGLHISRALTDENLGRAELSQGTGSLDTASSSNLGGAIQFYSVDPSAKRSATLSQTFGSDSTYRTFIKLESGELSSGTKFYVSYARQDLDKWKGFGSNYYDQVNAKLVQKIGSAKVSLFFDYSDRQEIDYQDLSLNYINVLGRNVDNYYPDFASALKAAQATQGLITPAAGFTHGELLTNDPYDVSYYAGSGLRTDYLGGATLDLPITENLQWHTTAYGHGNKGVGTWYTPYTASPSSAIAERTSEYGIERYGFVTKLIYDIGKHTVNTGVWYEGNNFDLARRFYDVSATNPSSPYDMPDPATAFFTQWAYSFYTDTVQFHIQDTYRATDDVTLSAGFKSLSVNTNGTLTANGAGKTYPQGSLEASEGFLPQAGLNWKITPDHEAFVNIAKNMRAYQVGGQGFGLSPWGAASQAAFDVLKQSIKPEESWTYEGGLRFHQDFLKGFDGLLAAYHVDFSNRLLAVPQGPGIAGGANILSNVGSVTTNGVELSGFLHPIEHVTWYNAASYNRSTYDDSYTSNGVVVPTAGKTVVDTPDWTYKTSLSYDSDSFFAVLDGDYMSRRFFTYTNDQSVPGRFIFNLGAGYKFQNIDFLTDAALKFNVYNLFDKQYISTLGTNGFPASGDTDTLQIGAPRQFFVTLSAKF